MHHWTRFIRTMRRSCVSSKKGASLNKNSVPPTMTICKNTECNLVMLRRQPCTDRRKMIPYNKTHNQYRHIKSWRSQKLLYVEKKTCPYSMKVKHVWTSISFWNEIFYGQRHVTKQSNRPYIKKSWRHLPEIYILRRRWANAMAQLKCKQYYTIIYL